MFRDFQWFVCNIVEILVSEKQMNLSKVISKQLLSCKRKKHVYLCPSVIINQYIFWYVILFSVTQSYPTICDPMGCSPWGSRCGIFLARILEWVVISSFRGPSWPRRRSPHLLYLLHCRRILYHWATGKAPDI